ncbi:hypothetical protein [Streptomyces spectabilis]|uniref:Uncharacterized protein n=1 Tax=Streptomyces spectabilis TaxID=68270 RepID=A0A5P2X5R0_STRST|nr:hypothetical protein [Streptomyces spectabilis]MBB5108350.1 hypothetical protein [Streptomyces spectabilis]MCI3901107.1 hypothetical protein [Streptomyces spectabilis]QEV58599.1 hypothetical protein CP982_07610 [Streptomyces spectabilis]GGV45996.1 hypothetical protein GCM10010245_72120 [Streptomyces spectabilis]
MDDAITGPAPDDGLLLPLVTLSEAQDIVEALALVAAGRPVDRRWAGDLASVLAARVPSRD